jgi:sugar phosphate isomerase/epimerase
MANKLAIPSISISQYPGHLLDKKIRAAASCGFAGIEIVYNDLEMYGNRKTSQSIPQHKRSTPYAKPSTSKC